MEVSSLVAIGAMGALEGLAEGFRGDVRPDLRPEQFRQLVDRRHGLR